MLKEQILDFAISALSKAYETKERIKKSLDNDIVRNYVQSLKDTALWIIENQNNARTRAVHTTTAPTQKTRKPRRTSIRAAKEIGSAKAEAILQLIQADGSRLVTRHDAVSGKTSLAYLIWALGHAERAQLSSGLSVHDVSALLYKACNIELYPINISRIIYGNRSLVNQDSQQKRAKTYVLTSEGHALFAQKFL